MIGNSRDSTKRRIVALNNNPLILTPPALDLNSESWTLKTRILTDYKPIKPCPTPEKIKPCPTPEKIKPCPSPEKSESESSTKESHHLKYKFMTREKQAK